MTDFTHIHSSKNIYFNCGSIFVRQTRRPTMLQPSKEEWKQDDNKFYVIISENVTDLETLTQPSRKIHAMGQNLFQVCMYGWLKNELSDYKKTRI